MADIKAGIRAVLLKWDGEMISVLNIEKITGEITTAIQLYLPSALKNALGDVQEADLVAKIKQNIQDYTIQEMVRILTSEGYTVSRGSN